MILKHIKKATLWHNPKEKLPKFTQNRISFVVYVFLSLYGLIACRLCSFVIFKDPPKIAVIEQKNSPRFDIMDRNGEIIATDIITHSVFADPLAILDKKEAAQALSKVFPKLSKKKLLGQFEKKGRFIWIARHIDPTLKKQIFNLGLSGIYFKEEFKRIYPHGALVSHIIGHCDPDNTGLYGIERSYDQHLKTKDKIHLSVDLRIQHIVRDELKKGIKKFMAKAGNAIIMDQDGQILAAVSLPDYDGENIKEIKNTFNRNFQGCYEPGSVLKILNVAISLQMNAINKNSTFDVRKPVKIGRFTVDDFQPKRRILSLTEAFIYSSNIAMIEMANCYGERHGIGMQKEFFQKLGLLERASLEVKELGKPIVPCQWTKSTFQTLAYGYGLAMPPISFLKAVGSILTNHAITPTLIKSCAKFSKNLSLFKPQVTEILENLMREVMLGGSGRKAFIPEYYLIGKTGTALQCHNGHYDKNKRNTTFISCLIDKATKRKFFILVMLEAPQPIEGTYGFATAGWNAVPITKEIVLKIAPILGICPTHETPTPEKNHEPKIQM